MGIFLREYPVYYADLYGGFNKKSWQELNFASNAAVYVLK
jgi:hypothetical protein